jgi:polyisoprenoid-binding protein YceI
MNKIISILAVLIIAVLILVSVNKKNDVKTVTENTVATSTVGAIQISDIKIADGIYSINPSDVKLTWTGKKVILKKWIDSGVVSVKEASFEIKDNSAISNKFVIDMTSITDKTNGAGGGQDKLTTHLKSADFFDVAQFPTSTFVAKELVADTSTSTKEIPANSKRFIINGDMAIKGVTNPISIPTVFTASTDGTSVTAVGSVDLDRTLWNVRYGSGKFFDNLGDNVIDDMFNITFETKISLASTTPTTASSTPVTASSTPIKK